MLAYIVRPIVSTMTGLCHALPLRSVFHTSHLLMCSWPGMGDLQLSLDLPGAYVDAGHELQEALQERGPVSFRIVPWCL